MNFIGSIKSNMEKISSNHKEVSLSRVLTGTSWGDFEIIDKTFKLTNNGKDWFSIHGSQIANLSSQNKNELGFEFMSSEKEVEE